MTDKETTENKSLHRAIQEAAKNAGLEPIEFEKPVKSVGAYYRLRKEIIPESLLDRHRAIGWGCACLVEYFEKELWSIKSLEIKNEKEKVSIEAIVYMSILTSEDNHIEQLDKMMESWAGEDRKAWGYFYYSAPLYKWDSVERISAVKGFVQIRGDGEFVGTV